MRQTPGSTTMFIRSASLLALLALGTGCEDKSKKDGPRPAAAVQTTPNSAQAVLPKCLAIAGQTSQNFGFALTTNYATPEALAYYNYGIGLVTNQSCVGCHSGKPGAQSPDLSTGEAAKAVGAQVVAKVQGDHKAVWLFNEATYPLDIKDMFSLWATNLYALTPDDKAAIQAQAAEEALAAAQAAQNNNNEQPEAVAENTPPPANAGQEAAPVNPAAPAADDSQNTQVATNDPAAAQPQEFEAVQPGTPGSEGLAPCPSGAVLRFR